MYKCTYTVCARVCVCGVCLCLLALTLVVFLQQIGNITPDPAADYQLYDRVVNVSSHNAVPFGLTGIITGILGGGCGLLSVKDGEKSGGFAVGASLCYL